MARHARLAGSGVDGMTESHTPGTHPTTSDRPSAAETERQVRKRIGRHVRLDRLWSTGAPGTAVPEQLGLFGPDRKPRKGDR